VRKNNAALRANAVAERKGNANLHAIWPEQWKLAQQVARSACQRSPGADFAATSKSLFTEIVKGTEGGLSITQIRDALATSSPENYAVRS
jgi:hypothetical protein